MTDEEEQAIVDGLTDKIARYLPLTREAAAGYAAELPDWAQMTPGIQAAIIRGMLYANQTDIEYLIDQLDANGLDWAQT